MPFVPSGACPLPIIKKTNGDKFASRSRKCVFVGYLFGQKGWKLFDLDTKEFFVSRDVIFFFEEVFPFQSSDDLNIVTENIFDTNIAIHNDFADYIFDEDEVTIIAPTPMAQPVDPTHTSLPITP